MPNSRDQDQWQIRDVPGKNDGLWNLLSWLLEQFAFISFTWPSKSRIFLSLFQFGDLSLTWLSFPLILQPLPTSLFFFVHNLFGLFVCKLLFRQVFRSRPQLIDLLRSLLSGCDFFASAISSEKKRLVLPDFTVIIKVVKVYTFSTEETDIYEDYTAFAQRKLGCNIHSLVNVNMIMLGGSFIQKKLYQITFWA